ncbi:NfeD family protein [Ammonicoccus fulvus]|uniref:NfeD family protein n=1 Tax=Ammonicoccus fulvus TaxID=3138240 RepID=A0ABZ3FMI9_9ACTN
MAWLLWLVAAAALGVAEFFTFTLAFGLLSAAALVGAVAAGLGAPFLIQILAFAVTAGLGLLVIRPIAVRQMARPARALDGTDALIGLEATVLEEVTGDRGLIKLSGEAWSARAYDDQLAIPPGSHVNVMEIQGATAIVYPRDF